MEVESEQEVVEALKFAKDKGLKVFVLGGGSNILISDAGFEGLVMHNKVEGKREKGKEELEIGGGEIWDEVVALAVEKNLAGIEYLSGVPGSAGGAVVQNIGAYGQTLADVVSGVQAIEAATGKTKIFSSQECEFDYRGSRFKRNPSKYIVTRFQLKLKPCGEPTITYPHVKKHFEKQPNPSLPDVRQFIIKLRASKGYLIMPGYECFKTAGSFFKNPIVSKQEFKKLKGKFGDSNLNRYWEQPGGVKLAAAFLMQEAGFPKGYREGNVGISPKHSLSLVNFDDAKAIEVKSLADKIKQIVFEKFGVKLEEEVLYVGSFT